MTRFKLFGTLVLVTIGIILVPFGRDNVSNQARAGCVVRSRSVVASAAVVASPIVIPAVLPAYGASYDASANELKALSTKIALLESKVGELTKYRDMYLSRLSVVEAKLGIAPAIPPPPPVNPPNGSPPVMPKADAPAATGNVPSLVSRSCVQCHSGDKPKGAFSIVDASGSALAQLSPEVKLEILRRINLPDTDPNVMPPKGKGTASDQEAAELLDALTRPNAKGK